MSVWKWVGSWWVAFIIPAIMVAGGSKAVHAGQSHGQVVKGGNQTNEQTVNGGDFTLEGSTVTHEVNTKQVKQAPSMAISASGPCIGAGAGLGVPGFGVQGVMVDDECSKREAARLAYMLGDRKLAQRLLESLEAVVALDRPKPVEVNAHGWPVK